MAIFSCWLNMTKISQALSTNLIMFDNWMKVHEASQVQSFQCFFRQERKWMGGREGGRGRKGGRGKRRREGVRKGGRGREGGREGEGLSVLFEASCQTVSHTMISLLMCRVVQRVSLPPSLETGKAADSVLMCVSGKAAGTGYSNGPNCPHFWVSFKKSPPLPSLVPRRLAWVRGYPLPSFPYKVPYSKSTLSSPSLIKLRIPSPPSPLLPL